MTEADETMPCLGCDVCSDTYLKGPVPACETIPLRQIDKLAQELYSQKHDLSGWWCESIKGREEWRDKAQAILATKVDQ